MEFDMFGARGEVSLMLFPSATWAKVGLGFRV